jgi:hypothetical protein
VKCGQRLDRSCAACGASYTEGDEFCGQCGASLAGAASVLPRPTAAPTESVAAAGSARRGHVSVLFADLVGVTSLSDQRDAEDVRDLLSRYFDTARTVITRCGGTVEKFIGDAVMAVWGSHAIQEDDAERAVRAALGLVDTVAAFGEEVGLTGLSARGGAMRVTGLEPPFVGRDRELRLLKEYLHGTAEEKRCGCLSGRR